MSDPRESLSGDIQVEKKPKSDFLESRLEVTSFFNILSLKEVRGMMQIAETYVLFSSWDKTYQGDFSLTSVVQRMGYTIIDEPKDHHRST